MHRITEQDKDEAINAYKEKQYRQYKTGKMIVLIIAISNIIGTILTSIYNFDLLRIIIQITLSIALYLGVRWVRYLFAIGSALGAILILKLFSEMNSSIPIIAIVIAVIYLAYCVISSIILFTNKSVSEFLYSQKNS